MNTMLLEPHVSLLAQELGKKLGESAAPPAVVSAAS
jgi:hypothetical protein